LLELPFRFVMAHLYCQSTRKQSAYISWTDPWGKFDA